NNLRQPSHRRKVYCDASECTCRRKRLEQLTSILPEQLRRTRRPSPGKKSTEVLLDSPRAELASSTQRDSAKYRPTEVGSKRIRESRTSRRTSRRKSEKTTEHQHRSAANVEADGQNAQSFTSDDPGLIFGNHVCHRLENVGDNLRCRF